MWLREAHIQNYKYKWEWQKSRSLKWHSYFHFIKLNSNFSSLPSEYVKRPTFFFEYHLRLALKYCLNFLIILCNSAGICGSVISWKTIRTIILFLYLVCELHLQSSTCEQFASWVNFLQLKNHYNRFLQGQLQMHALPMKSPKEVQMYGKVVHIL